MAHPLLSLLAAHLASRRDEILRSWRDAIRKDALLTAGDALPKRQLNDHVPAALDGFERKLNAMATGADAGTEVTRIIDAAGAHGLHRWQQGYDLRQVMRELGHLNRLLVTEIDRFSIEVAQCEPLVLSEARQAWAEAYSSGVEESANQFFNMQQIEANSHIADLEHAARDVSEIEARRNEF
ncbi:RsbRD N-terminal domain-containing protein [Variovorax sp. RHLX14]|uniref:RsbRD N-terminal domain-containing protein n=1 Tax=Variovorax sp. RHLX14 TaxID=1259731 RepID=UPI003F4716CE